MAKQKSIHEKLTELAGNYWWSWEPEVTSLFRAIDNARWSQLSHNPVTLLEEYPPERLEQRAREEVLHSRINWAYRRWVEYMESRETWGSTHAAILGQRPVAYFSAEFGLHESLPVYSGAAHGSSAVCLSECRVLQLPRSRYDELLQAQEGSAFQIALNSAEILGTRLQETDQWLQALLRDEQSHRIAESWSRFRSRILSSGSSMTGGVFTV